MNWKALPFLRLLLPFAAGIWVSVVSNRTIPLPLGIFLCCLLLVLIGWLSARVRRWQQRLYFGYAVFAWLFLLGLMLSSAHAAKQHPRHITRLWAPGQVILAIAEQVYNRGEFLHVKACAHSLLDKDATTMQPTSGKLLLNLAAGKKLAPGDTLLFNSSLDTFSRPLNPQAFDYGQYMSRRQVFLKGYADTSQWFVWAPCTQPGWRVLAERLRLHCVALLQQHLPTPNEMSVGLALVLGYQDAIPDEVNQAYSFSGAMHVLSVSGLHVGLIYGALEVLVKPLKRKRWGKALRVLILILGIWAFAFLTGAGAAVLRAAAMFSLLVLGQALHRRVNIYNTLAASAFLLLCANPFLLFDMGFQLSYLALLGIVCFNPLIYRCWYIPWKAGDYLWQLTSVGLAAQLATFPLSVYYFHQFPLYFWLSGWLVVPAAALILYLGCLLLVFHAVPLLAPFFGKIMYWLVWGLNTGVFWVRDLPAGQSRYLSMSLVVMLVLYGVIFLGAIFWHTRRGPWALAALSGLALAGVLQGIMAWRMQGRREMVVYYLRGHTAIDLFEGRQLISWSDLPPGDTQLEWACGGYRSSRYLSAIYHLPLPDSVFSTATLYNHQGIFQFGKTKVALVNQPLNGDTPAKPLEVDYLILRSNPRVTVRELSQFFQFECLIADASNRPWRTAAWQLDCERLGISFVDIASRGALCVNVD